METNVTSALDPGVRSTEDEDSVELFTVLCRHNDVIFVISALGWQCKRCNVSCDFGSDESMDSHLRYFHDIDTQGKGCGKTEAEVSNSSAVTQETASEAARSVCSQGKKAGRRAVEEQGDAATAAGSSATSLSSFGRSRKRTLKAMEAEHVYVKKSKRSRKSDNSSVTVPDVSPLKLTASRNIASKTELFNSSAEMQPSVVLTKMDMKPSSHQVKINSSTEVVAKKKLTNIKKTASKQKMSMKIRKAGRKVKQKASRISNYYVSKRLTDVSSLHDKYVGKLSPQTHGTSAECTEEGDGVSMLEPEPGQSGAVQTSPVKNIEEQQTHSHHTNRMVETSPVQVSASSLDTTSVALTARTFSEDITLESLAESEVRVQTEGGVPGQSAGDGHGLLNLPAAQCLEPPHVEQSVEEQPSSTPKQFLEDDHVTESAVQILAPADDLVSSHMSDVQTSIPDVDNQLIVDSETVGNIITITLPVKLQSSDQGEMALLIEDQPVGSGITVVNSNIVPSANSYPDSSLSYTVAEQAVTSGASTVEGDPAEAAVGTILPTPALIQVVVNSSDQHQEDQENEVTAEMAETSTESAKNKKRFAIDSTVPAATEKKRDCKNSGSVQRPASKNGAYRLGGFTGSTPPSRIVSECDFCHHPFIDTQSLQAHIKHYQDQQPVQCKTCQEKFHNLDLLNLHIFFEHDKDSNPSCLTCEKSYLNRRSLTEHIASVHPTSKGLTPTQLRLDSLGTEQCRVCGIHIRKDPKLVELHYKAHNKADFSCRTCGKWYKRRYLLYAHFQLQHNQDRDGGEFSSDLDEETLNKVVQLLEEENASCVGHVAIEPEPPQSFSCKVCQKDLLDTRRGILKHLMKHYGPTNSEQVMHDVYECPDCRKEIPNVGQNINYHRLTHGHVDAENIKLKCSVCSAFYPSEGTVRRHERYVHKLDKHKPCRRCICEVCGKEFADVPQLKKHVALHSEDKGLFTCDVCNKGFPFKSRMEAHRAKHKLKGKVTACQHCGKEYMTKVSLDRHIQVVHLGVKDYKYKCDQCPAQFFDSIQLRDHVATKHEGKRPYSCRLCAQTFVCRTTLNRHLRRDHEGHNPFVCKTCGEKFTEKHHLVRHESLVHKGVEPFACSLCQKVFGTQSSLKRHMDMHRGIRPYLCEDCGMGFGSNKDLNRHRSKACAVNKRGSNRYKVQVMETVGVDAVL